MNKQSKQILFVIVVFCLAALIATFIWHGDSLYSGAYAPMVEKAIERQKIENPVEEPHAPGFKEKDIDKQQGEGFNTY